MTSDTLRKFNRDTRWLAAGVLGLVATAALTLASLDQRPLPKEDHLAQQLTHLERDLVVNANPRPRPPQSVSNGEGLNAQGTSGWIGSADNAFVAGPLKEISSFQTPVVTLNSPPIVTFPPEIIRFNAQANAASASSGQVAAPPARPKMHLPKRPLSGVRRVIDVKARLIALWHQSLKREQKVRSWTTFSNLSGGAKKKAAYTAETSH